MGLASMGPAIFIIAIMGCGEGDAPCQQVRTLEARYESQAACTAATEAALIRNTDIDYPVVAAECVAAGAKPAQLKANEVQRPGPGRADLKVSPLRS
ncbi:MAG TPA: hypothetical protein VD846_00545 [Allosphingosinicella sp.]|nr:hypothetical protein [Allosphingosinicella sp.]